MKKYNTEQVNRMVGIIHRNSITVNIGAKTIIVQSPTCGTIEQACRYLSMLPKIKIEETDNNLLGKLVKNANLFSPSYYAVAMLLYGEKKCDRRRFVLFGPQNIKKYAARLKSDHTPKEIQEALFFLLGTQVCSDFFGMVSAIMSVLIVETE